MKKCIFVLLLSVFLSNGVNETNRHYTKAEELLYNYEVKKNYHIIDFSSIKANSGTPAQIETINKLLLDSKCGLKASICDGLFWNGDGLKFGSNKVKGNLILYDNTFEFGELTGYAYNAPVYNEYGSIIDWRCDNVSIEINCDGPCAEYTFPTNNGDANQPDFGHIQFTSLMNDSNNPKNNKPHSDIDIYSTSELGQRFVITKIELWNAVDPQEPVFKDFTYNPLRDVYEKNIEINYDHPIPTEDILANVIAINPTTNKRIPVDFSGIIKNNDPHKLIEKYTISLSATSSGLTAYANIFVHLVDTTAPTIIGPEELVFGYTNPVNIPEILSNYNYTDNINKKVSLSIIEDNYTPNKDKIGNYSVTILARDSFNNISEKSIVIKVVDDSAPIINGPSHILKSSSANLSINEICNMFVAVDDICHIVPIKVLKETYTGNETITGIYNIILSTKDNFDNETQKEVIIEVSNLITSDSYLVDQNKLFVANTTFLSKNDIKNFLKLSNINTDNVEIYNTEYEAAPSVIGRYECVITLDSNQSINLEIDVFKDKSDIQITPQKRNFFARIWEGFKSFWIKLWNLITKGKWELNN